MAQESNTTVRQTLDASNSYWITTAKGSTQVRADSSGAPGRVLKTFSGGCYATAGGLVQMLSSSGPFDHAGSPLARHDPLQADEYDFEHIARDQLRRPRGVPLRRRAARKPLIVAPRGAQGPGGRGALLRLPRRRGATDHLLHHEVAGLQRPVATRARPRGCFDQRGRGRDQGQAGVVRLRRPNRSGRTSRRARGGHTANIEDVWTNASPKPYYKGVADADGASPYYTWTSPAFSAKTVAEKIRALDIARGGGLEYSVAAPAVVTGIATERAASGYTHHVRITWSTGNTFRLTGATLQSAMRLRSSKFAVTRTYPLVSRRRYQESDSRLAWHWILAQTLPTRASPVGP